MRAPVRVCVCVRLDIFGKIAKSREFARTPMNMNTFVGM